MLLDSEAAKEFLLGLLLISLNCLSGNVTERSTTILGEQDLALQICYCSSICGRVQKLSCWSKCSEEARCSLRQKAQPPKGFGAQEVCLFCEGVDTQ
jgi:hypothetical protein